MKSIFTALVPNVENDDAWLAFKLQFLPWRWKRGLAVGRLSDALKQRLDKKHLFLFETGRTGLEIILKSAGISVGDEVLLQAFTCVAVPNAVLWTGAKAVYVDCNEEYTMSVEDFKKKITARSKAVIIQHTFGNMADFDAISVIAREHGLLVIEDCAHSFAMHGDLGFFSFGRDMAFSSVFGGAVVTDDDALAEKLRVAHARLPQAGWWWIGRQLKYVVNIWLVRATFDWGIGRVLLALMRLFPNKPVLAAEKLGRKPRFLGHQMPNALAELALHQLAKLDRFNEHRKKIAAIYAKAFPGSGILRFAFSTLHSEKLRAAARQAGIFLGDWYTTAIAPTGVSYEKIGYDPAKCPTAERLTRNIINLPTDIHITEQDAERIISCIHSFNQ